MRSVDGICTQFEDSQLTHQAGPEFQVRILRTLAEVEEIRRAWSGWKTHRDSNIDVCLQFVWVREEVIRPHVIVIHRYGRPDAMLVGRLERSRTAPKVGYVRLPGIRSFVLMFSYKGLLGNASDENCREITKSIIESLKQGEADVASLDHLDVSASFFQSALKLPRFVSRDHLTHPAPHHLMRLPANVEDVYRGFSGGHRSELKRKAKKLLSDHQGSVKVCCYRAPDELDTAIPQVEQVAKKSYLRGLGVGFQDSELMRRRLRLFAQNGWLRIYLLFVKEMPCAFWVGTVYEDSFCSDYLAFDNRFADYSPGMFLLMKMIEDFCAAGIREIDFGFGEGRYKERFGNYQTMESSVQIFAASLKGFALNITRTTAVLVDNALKKTLERGNLLGTVKKLWRGSLARQATVE